MDHLAESTPHNQAPQFGESELWLHSVMHPSRGRRSGRFRHQRVVENATGGCRSETSCDAEHHVQMYDSPVITGSIRIETAHTSENCSSLLSVSTPDLTDLVDRAFLARKSYMFRTHCQSQDFHDV